MIDTNAIEWFSIDEIELIEDNDDTLYCLAVDAPEHQFLIGESGIPTHNTDEAKEADALKGEAKMIIGSIARLGRAAGVHLVVATQRPDAELIPGETRANLAARIGCGRMDPSASQMLFGSSVGARTPSDPPGGVYIQIYAKGNRGQGFFAPDNWLDKYYEKHPEQMPVIEGEEDPNSEFAEIPKEQEDGPRKTDPLEDWDEDMDEIASAGRD